jgi:GST-like protein
MIELHFWPTPNAWKITIMLEETGLDYRLSQVNLSQGEQFGPGFSRDLSQRSHAGDHGS